MFYWGLIPPRADDPAIGNRMINARAETVPEESAFKARRCLILVDGFYEGQKTGNGKQLHHLRVEDGSPFAGLWEIRKNGERIRSCATISTEANDPMGEVPRTPVILHPEDRGLWLDPCFSEKEPVTALLKPYSTRVWKPTR